MSSLMGVGLLGVSVVVGVGAVVALLAFLVELLLCLPECLSEYFLGVFLWVMMV